MKDLFRRLISKPSIFITLVIVSFIANLLALASPIFVMLVLGRYVSQGIDATLITLSIGVLIAIVMEFLFKSARQRFARNLNLQKEIDLAVGSAGLITTCPVDKLGASNQQYLQTQRNLDIVSSAFSSNNLCSILDAPFALLFLVVLYSLNPLLGLLATGFIVLVTLLRFVVQAVQTETIRKLENVSSSSNISFTNLVRSPDSTRLFDQDGWLMSNWSNSAVKKSGLRARQAIEQGLAETSVATLQALLGAVIIAFGATLVVSGDLSVSALIGANLLAARAFAPISRLSQLTPALVKADASLKALKELSNLAEEQGKTTPVQPCRGTIELRDVSFTHQGMPIPLYDKLSLQVPSGRVLVIKGSNGAGKTTLLRLLLGLLKPETGQIFADGIDIQQLSEPWWRAQIGYMPQEPWFFDATMKDNLLAANPNLDASTIAQILEITKLRSFVEEHPLGLDMLITGGGVNLALGIRKRFALARMLVNSTRIVLLDEPTDGLDDLGKSAILGVLNLLSRQRKTTILVTNDRELEKRAHFILDLDHRPYPDLQEVGFAQPTGGQS